MNGCGGWLLLAVAVLTAVSLLSATQEADADLVVSLPGLTFKPNFKQFSGYLDVSSGNQLHYWLVEAQTNPASAPLILWLNGGPGCSSLSGLFTEHGPFHPNPDDQTLFENVFSWNKAANVLYVEAPVGVGFSYRPAHAAADNAWNDEQSAQDIVDAINVFVNRFPQYEKRDFYVAGEGYGGVYASILVEKMIKKVQMRAHLVGMVVGNGGLSKKLQINSAIDLNYYRGVFGMTEYEELRNCCSPDELALSNCDFSKFVHFDSHGSASPKPGLKSAADLQCAKNVIKYGFYNMWGAQNDVLNTYQDCYAQKNQSYATQKRQMESKLDDSSTDSFVDFGAFRNLDSTDNLGGFQCYMNDATQSYLRLKEVRQALHIPDEAKDWVKCSDSVHENYVQEHHDLTPVFNSILNSGYSLRILIYNGDLDLTANFMGDTRFVESLASQNSLKAVKPFESWFYVRTAGRRHNVGGYKTQYAFRTGTLDHLTVKGAGHFVPTDRPAQALQMIHSFIFQTNYSIPVPYSGANQPLLPQYAGGNVIPSQGPSIQASTTKPKPSNKQFKAKPGRREADRVGHFPGLTFSPNFAQYAGYLDTKVPGNHLHYVFVESQNDPATDPVVVWFNGGPACSSMSGFFTQMGPFYPNPDGDTLFENVYSWNKGANVIFLDMPRGVGFSYQDTSVSNDTTYNDRLTAEDNMNALIDFFGVHAPFQKNEFYIAGYSYAGIYISTLTQLLVHHKNRLNFNFKGIMIGNGAVSAVQNVRSLPDYLYFHGQLARSKWQFLRTNCCSKEGLATARCQYDQYVDIAETGDSLTPKPSNSSQFTACADAIIEVMNYAQSDGNLAYNIYQDCYTAPEGAYGSAFAVPGSSRRKNGENFRNQLPKLNFDSTDSFKGFACYNGLFTDYLNLADVRTALHVPASVPEFESCADVDYDEKINDATDVFKDILVNAPSNFKILLYVGDVDTMCGLLETQWFVENLYSNHKSQDGVFVVQDHQPWFYSRANEFKRQIAGYQKSFQFGSTRLELLTVKGAGHAAISDRPGPGLQMLDNFVKFTLDSTTQKKAVPFSNLVPYSLERKPLSPQYQPTSTTPTAGPTSTTASTTVKPKSACSVPASVMSTLAIAVIVKFIF